jgi:probable HAF family extracellular repeat protein
MLKIKTHLTIFKQHCLASVVAAKCIIALGLLLGITGLARAELAFTTIDVPGSSRTAVNGNSPNAIAGEYDDANGLTHGFILRGGAYKPINVPVPAAVTTINGIAANGQLVGTYIDTTGVPGVHAFFWGASFIPLNPPGSVRSQGGFLNAQGQVVGAYRTPDQKRHGFIWYKGTFSTFNVPNDHPLFGTVPQGINDRGDIVGSYVDVQGIRLGFLWRQGAYTTLRAPDAGNGIAPNHIATVALGTNNSGTVVGAYEDQKGQIHGFIWKNGGYTKVDVPGSTYTAINSINAQGEIAGVYDDANGVTHGFVAR